MKVLVAYGTKAGATGGIAEAIGEMFRESGLETDVVRVEEAGDPASYGAVVVGSAVYAGKWRREAVRFLRRNQNVLAARPVWLFQSGPLDHKSASRDMKLPGSVGRFASFLGVRGHVTFGGALAPDAKGFIAGAMAKRMAGDYREFDAIRGWASRVARELLVMEAAA